MLSESCSHAPLLNLHLQVRRSLVGLLWDGVARESQKTHRARVAVGRRDDEKVLVSGLPVQRLGEKQQAYTAQKKGEEIYTERSCQKANVNTANYTRAR